MKKKIIITVFSLVGVLCFSQTMKGKWTAEFNLNCAHEFNNYKPATGLDYGVGINYHIFNRLGVSTQLHSFQQIFPWVKSNSFGTNYPMTYEEYHKSNHNLSYMLWNINAFGDIFVSKNNNRLRFQIGATYMRGANVAVNSWTNTDVYGKIIGGGNGRILTLDYDNINSIGMNINLSYLINLSSRFYMNVNTSAYSGGITWFWEDPYFDFLSLGLSIGYKF